MIDLVVAEVPEPNFGCGMLDAGCLANEQIVRLMIGAVVGMGDFTADVLVNAFDQTVSNDQWSVAFDQWGIWAGLMIIVVATVMLYQLTVGVIMQNRKRMSSAVIGGLLAVPFASFTVVLMTKVTAFVDDSSQKVLTTIQGGKIGTAILQSIGLSADQANLGEIEVDTPAHEAMQTAVASQSIAALFPALIVMLLMMIGGMLLMAAMIVRDYGLLILAALAPIALMLVGQGKLMAWGEKWFSLVTGLLLVKPITAGILCLVVNVQAESAMTWAELIVGALIMFFCAFAPFWVVKMVDFAGNEIGSAWASRPSMRGGLSRTSMVSNAAINIKNTAVKVGSAMRQSAQRSMAWLRR